MNEARTKFETYAAERYLDTSWCDEQGGYYTEAKTGEAWTAWQAALASSDGERADSENTPFGKWYANRPANRRQVSREVWEAALDEAATVSLEQRCERGTPWDLAITACVKAIRGLKGGDFQSPVRDGERERLRTALERVLHNFKLVLSQKSCRDAAETIGEAERALAEAPK